MGYNWLVKRNRITNKTEVKHFLKKKWNCRFLPKHYVSRFTETERKTSLHSDD